MKYLCLMKNEREVTFMTVKELIEDKNFDLVCGGKDKKEISKPFCCDLLSFAMSKAPAGSAWVTVMGNVNTIAVAALSEVACVILSEGVELDQAAVEKAMEHEITVVKTKLPSFDAALCVQRRMENGSIL